MRKLINLLVSVLVLALALFVWYNYFHIKYDTTSPKRGTAIDAVYATGVIEPKYWSKISPAIAGSVAEVLVRENQEVREGQVLVQLEDQVEREQLNELKARLDYLKAESERQEKLRAKDVASVQKHEKALSAARAIEAEIKAQERLLDRMKLKSPMDGVVLKEDIEPGEYIKLGEVVVWVGLPRPLRITADVDEEDIPLVTKGQQVVIKADAFPNEIFRGTVGEITPKGDPISKNFRVRINLPDNTKLLIGMTVEVNIVAREVNNALLVPRSSVIGDHVWIIKDHSIERKLVKTGIENEEQVQILQGLTETDLILLNPLEYINNNE